MSSRLNLNDNIDTTFPFSIGGLDYDLKYPTLDELQPFTDLTAKRELALKKENNEEVAQIDNEMSEVFYSLITPVGHSTPIKDTLSKQPIPVVKRFNKMISEQLAAE